MDRGWTGHARGGRRARSRSAGRRHSAAVEHRCADAGRRREATGTPDGGTEGAAARHQADVPAGGESDVLSQIRIEGNRRVEPEAVKRALKNKVGRPFDPALTADGHPGALGLGYFQDIQLLVQRLPTGGIVYVVRVVGAPVDPRVEAPGQRGAVQGRLQGQPSTSSRTTILDLDAVRRNVKKIQEKYVEKGFFLAEVTHRIEPVRGRTGRRGVRHPRARQGHGEGDQLHRRREGVRRRAQGRDGHPEGSFFSFLTGEGTYREEAFQRDLAIIQAAYYDRGFINVKVEKPTVALSPDKRLIYITIKIDEGEQYRIGKLDFSGDLLVPKEQLIAVMTSQPGELFSRAKLSQGHQSLTDIYYDQGYAYANINPDDRRSIPRTADHRPRPSTCRRASRSTIERIEIVGNTKTRDKVIRRELRVYEGELFSGSGHPARARSGSPRSASSRRWRSPTSRAATTATSWSRSR